MSFHREKDLEARHEALTPWYRQADGRHSFRVDSCVEFERLMDAAGDAGMPLWLLCQTAELIAEHRGCELREAWDRLALFLERAVDPPLKALK